MNLRCKLGKHKYDPAKGRGTMGYTCARCDKFVWDRGPYVGPPIEDLDIAAEMRSMGRTMADYQPTDEVDPVPQTD